MPDERAPKRWRVRVINASVTLFVASALSLTIASGYAPVASHSTLVLAGALCLGPLLPVFTGGFPRHLEGVLMYAALLVPLVALLYGYRRLEHPASIALFAMAALYWVALGWFEGIGIYI
jgi:hypothetical protein